jgi:RNA polymerase sigma-70 factor (ECF subfamily)
MSIMKNNIEDIWLKFGNKLKVFIVSKVKNESIADDILQDAFVKIHANIDKLKDDAKIQPWIYQITRNLIVDHFRGIKKDRGELQNLFPDADDSSDDFMSEALQDMIQMMGDLPPEYCEALCLTELDGLSQKVYAEKKGISYTAAKARVQRARKKLKDMLMNCCHYQFDRYGTVIGIYPAHCCCCND